jgi:hypothetical protein
VVYNASIKVLFLRWFYGNTLGLAPKALICVAWVEERRRKAASRRVTQQLTFNVGFHFVIVFDQQIVAIGWLAL